MFLLKLGSELQNLLKNSNPFWRYKQNTDCIATKRNISTKWNATPPPPGKFPPGIFSPISLIALLHLTLRFDKFKKVNIRKLMRGDRGQLAVEKSVCINIRNTKLWTKKCYWFPRRVLLCLLFLLYYTIIQILTIVFTSVNKSTS